MFFNETVELLMLVDCIVLCSCYYNCAVIGQLI